MKIAIIGSTGVLGTKISNFLHKKNIKINLITCFANDTKLNKQSLKFNVNKSIVLSNSLKNSKFTNLLYGDSFLFDYIDKNKIDLIYILNIGYETLRYIRYIISRQKNCTIAIANKELLVAGGPLLIDSIYESKNNFLPLDSEHFSLINLINSRNSINTSVNKVYITATGGPFYFKKNFDIKKVTLKDAIKHPIWKMGYKNSIDSSNLVNKILELFELSSMLNLPLNKIDILISPKAFIHSVVFYNDQRISINCFKNDMLIPMSYPFSSTHNTFIKNGHFNLLNNNLNLIKFNNKKFEIYNYYKKIQKFTHCSQILFMMLNSEAVKRFINNDIRYSQIIPFIMNNINKFTHIKKFNNLSDIVKYMDNQKLLIRQL